MSKRFKLFTGNNYGVQSVDGEVFIDSIVSIGDADVLVDLLNDLSDENEHLKIRLNEEKEKALKFCRNIDTLTIENEHLKQENKQLKHWNKCLAEKRHQELSYGYYTDSKAEKRVKDLFEHKPLNCSDRIKSDRYD